MNPSSKRVDYRSAGVNIDAGNEAVERIKPLVRRTFGPEVLTGLGSFGSLFDLKSVLQDYRHPVLVQSIDGVGTKIMIATRMNRYDTIGRDLVAACCNDIAVLGARPLTFLDYIANDSLDPDAIELIVGGMAEACSEIGVALVGGETAEMPGTYRPGEKDLVGVVTGVVEKERVITGKTIRPGDVALGLPSSGLHTNGYSLARKLFFDVGQFDVEDTLPELNTSIGETLLIPHINYTDMIRAVLDCRADVRGLAHITGGGLMENVPRILPPGCGLEIEAGSWPVLPVFQVMKELGHLDDGEMFRTFNMGIGLVIVVAEAVVPAVRQALRPFTPVYTIGRVIPDEKRKVYISGQEAFRSS